MQLFKNKEDLSLKKNLMPYKIPHDIKSGIIEAYLQGTSRDEIARDLGLGAGTVSNILAEWKNQFGKNKVDGLRELAINLKKIGITATKCARGFVMVSTLNKLGVEDDSFESFILNIYEHCQKIGVASEKISSYLGDLISFSEIVPFSQIEQFLEEKKQRNRNLEESKQNLEKNIEALKKQESVVKANLNTALNNEKMTKDDSGLFSNLKAELQKYNLEYISDIPRFVGILAALSEYGFDPKKVLSEYQGLSLLKMKFDILVRQTQEISNKKIDLERVCSILQQRENLHVQRLLVYDELESMGLGLDQLKILCNTIHEIANEYGMSYFIAIKEFFRDLRKNTM